jgi:TfoX/Sxy family transcriptional regulator of competence genes
MPTSKKTARKTAKTANKASPVSTWTKAPEALVRLFNMAIEQLPQAETRQMFGYPAAFTNGKMFAGLHQDNMVLRLPDDERSLFLQQPGARVFEPMPGRPMREYVVAPPALLASTADLVAWLEKAFAYTSTLPPKKPSRRK